MILVTGATGLVGAHLLLHLVTLNQENKPIKAIYRSKSSIEKTKSLFELYDKLPYFERIVWVQADITDIPSLEIAFQGITKVYHCAAKISFDPNEEEILRKINIEGTANIVNFCIDKKVEKLCHVSSIAALGASINKALPVTESTEWNPELEHSDYAITKYGAEMEVFRGEQEGLKTVIVNPGIILGPYPKTWDKTQGSGALFTSVKKGIPFFTKGNTGYVTVNDVVKAMVMLMEFNVSGQRYILVSENISYQNIINLVAHQLRVKTPTKQASNFLLDLAWRVDWFLHLIFRKKRSLSKQSALALQNTEIISSEKIQKDFGFTFTPIAPYIEQIAKYF
ncbi:nucleoside-diphosphate-sugar epimerase [Flavobacterium croceum DSM 17960]|uniref:Nucleoside-diphosphate-sugar epimerase n=1 Tax=Flavobacterium croceum DSM 17960 TaxID=1121886 RepID=A0A2S4NAE1_9FLAO|nr:NAD-dependent epimerase/dehydratase family protein [Flavobacterium croceum]POS02669.1 nucleoside-diphosphate-sugar epimerase [Flavobacterium croceum DSM 17960]